MKLLLISEKLNGAREKNFQENSITRREVVNLEKKARVGVGQMRCVMGNTEANLETIERLCRLGQAQDLQLLRYGQLDFSL